MNSSDKGREADPEQCPGLAGAARTGGTVDAIAGHRVDAGSEHAALGVGIDGDGELPEGERVSHAQPELLHGRRISRLVVVGRLRLGAEQGVDDGLLPG